MRITTNGQVTIPKGIRDRLGFLPHTEVEFIVEGETVRIVKAKPTPGETRGDQVIRLLKGHKGVGLSTDEIMELTRGE